MGLETFALFFDRAANSACNTTSIVVHSVYRDNSFGHCREFLDWVVRRTISEWGEKGVTSSEVVLETSNGIDFPVGITS
jgi:hypothetical protein